MVQTRRARRHPIQGCGAPGDFSVTLWREQAVGLSWRRKRRGSKIFERGIIGKGVWEIGFKCGEARASHLVLQGISERFHFPERFVGRPALFDHAVGGDQHSGAVNSLAAVDEDFFAGIFLGAIPRNSATPTLSLWDACNPTGMETYLHAPAGSLPRARTF